MVVVRGGGEEEDRGQGSGGDEGLPRDGVLKEVQPLPQDSRLDSDTAPAGVDSVLAGVAGQGRAEQHSYTASSTPGWQTQQLGLVEREEETGRGEGDAGNVAGGGGTAGSVGTGWAGLGWEGTRRAVEEWEGTLERTRPAAATVPASSASPAAPAPPLLASAPELHCLVPVSA